MKGITYCGACADYDIKKHRCKRGAKLESNPQDKFFDDCPLLDAVPVRHGAWYPCFEDWRQQQEGNKCSVCGFEYYGTGIRSFHYCPHPEIGMDYDCGDSWWEIADEDLKSACLAEKEFRYYASGREEMYGWHISDLKIYDVPLELTAFRKPELPTGLRYEEDVIKRPPQNWCYVEELK